MTADHLDTFNNPHLDAVALIYAQQRHDDTAVDRILTSPSTDLHGLALVLAQKVATGVRSDRMSLEGFLEMDVDKTLDRAAEDDPEDDK